MMGRIELPDELRQFIDRQIAEGRVESEVDFVVEAVRRFSEALELHEEEINVAAEDGIADFEAGRFELISGPDDMTRL